jgi:hypothetical protein
MRVINMIGVSTLALLISPSNSQAGCVNYTDGSTTTAAPTVRICFDQVCDITTLDYECANASGGTMGYAVGWRIESSTSERSVYWKDKKLPVSKYHRLTCVPLSDPDACFSEFDK